MRHPPAFDGARGFDGFTYMFARDETAREAVWPPHAVAGAEVLEEGALGEEIEESLGRAVQHQ